ncbi:MAG: hypothetical protein M3Y31_01675 [Gemmatimonadota bacterium]|jgi:hypothetical protein|nr:hypothetical protein [Gemmatimonadota bacterium]
MATQLDVELAALRRRRSPGLYAWLRSQRPFDRRAIREPDERDAYWAVVQQRLAESDYVSLTKDRADTPPERPGPVPLLIGDASQG